MNVQRTEFTFDDQVFEIEIIDESIGEVLTFDDPAIFAQYEAAHTDGRDFTHPSVRRRFIELRDQLVTITGELEMILARAA